MIELTLYLAANDGVSLAHSSTTQLVADRLIGRCIDKRMISTEMSTTVDAKIDGSLPLR
jgi:hypothetical protein